MSGHALIRAGLAAACMVLAGTASAQTLKTVKDRGTLVCGVSQGVLGFSTTDDKGVVNGFDADFCRAVGNYGEIFERNIGSRSKLGIPRGINHLWSLGGIQYAPPMR